MKFLQEVADAAESLDETDVEGFLSHHRDVVILDAINEARKSAEIDISVMQRRCSCIIFDFDHFVKVSFTDGRVKTGLPTSSNFWKALVTAKTIGIHCSQLQTPQQKNIINIIVIKL